MAIIKNFDSLSTTLSRRNILEIIEAGIISVLPENLIRHTVQYDTVKKVLTVNNDTFDVSSGRIFVIGGGKASGRMAQVLEGIIGSGNITDGIVNCKGEPTATQKVRIRSAGHPIPDERGVDGVREMLALKDRHSIREKDIIIALISGGGSALLPCPVKEIRLEDKQAITDIMINSGAEIVEINTVRKHLSQVKGGQLGRHFHPAKIISLIISDVTGNDLSVIASGPTVPDKSTFTDACRILDHYHLMDNTPESVKGFLEKVIRGDVAETCKELMNCYNYIIGDNLIALNAMRDKTCGGLASENSSGGRKSHACALARISRSVSPSKGLAPVSMKYSTPPRLNTSLRSSTSSTRPWACSGDIYE